MQLHALRSRPTRHTPLRKRGNGNGSRCIFHTPRDLIYIYIYIYSLRGNTDSASLGLELDDIPPSVLRIITFLCIFLSKPKFRNPKPKFRHPKPKFQNPKARAPSKTPKPKPKTQKIWSDREHPLSIPGRPPSKFLKSSNSSLPSVGQEFQLPQPNLKLLADT